MEAIASSEWELTRWCVVICFAMLMCNFLAAGPSIAMVSTTMDFFPGTNPRTTPALFGAAVAQTSYFFTSTALMQGVGNFFWVPIANKYGRRPTYVFSYLIYTVSGACPYNLQWHRLTSIRQACAIWLCFDHTFSGFLAGRILMGFGAGAAETIGKPPPLTGEIT